MEYYCKLPDDIAEREVIVLDPMLATGGSAVDAIGQIKKRGAVHIKFIAIIGAPEGLERLQREHPDVDLYIAALDEKLNENGYIVPGLGDAGLRRAVERNARSVELNYGKKRIDTKNYCNDPHCHRAGLRAGRVCLAADGQHRAYRYDPHDDAGMHPDARPACGKGSGNICPCGGHPQGRRACSFSGGRTGGHACRAGAAANAGRRGDRPRAAAGGAGCAAA